MKKSHTISYCLFALMFFPSIAWANAATPLMWAGMLHLLFGNAIIGWVEGTILARIYGLRYGRCQLLMIGANYFSAWIGGGMLAEIVANRFQVNLYNISLFLITMAAFTYLLTLILEFPFIVFCLRKKDKWLGKSLRGSLIIQSISYVVLFGWYWMASDGALITQTNIVTLSEMSLPNNVWVYYIADKDKNIYRRTLGENDEIKIYDYNQTDDIDRLFVQPSTVNPDRWDLMARLETPETRKTKIFLIEESISALDVPTPRDSTIDMHKLENEETWFNFGEVMVLKKAQDSKWSFETGFWAIGGLHGEHAETGKTIHLSFEIPFVAWMARNATHLPGDIVLFQLGHHQICVYNPETNNLALFAFGRGPVAVMKEQ